MKPEAKAAFDKWAIGVFNYVSDPSFEVIGVIAEDAWSEAWDTAIASAWACAVMDAEVKTALLLKKQLTQELTQELTQKLRQELGQVIPANHVSPLLMPLAVTTKKACCRGCSCKVNWNLNSRFFPSRPRPSLAETREFELVI